MPWIQLQIPADPDTADQLEDLLMEMGADAVLVNTAIAQAQDPVAMGKAFRLGVEAGRMAYLAGRIPTKPYAVPSSPIENVVQA